jgi:hypothetical protein
MPIDTDNACAVLRLNGLVVACAEAGGKIEDKKITLRNLTLTKDGHRLLLGEDEGKRKELLEQGIQLVPGRWSDALSKILEIEIRNNDGGSTAYQNCRADFGGRGLSNMTATELLSTMDFCILEP